jgi:putative peptidoglycan lipid II flippase
MSVKKASLLLSFTLLLSNLLGFFRNIILAKFVTPFEYLDAYFAAFKWPDLIFNLLILGAVSTALVPIYSEIKVRSSTKEALDYASRLLLLTTLIMILLLISLYFLMPFLAQSLVRGASPEIKNLTASLGRLLLLSPFFFGLSYVVSGVLQAESRFFFYALAPLIYNLSIIVGGLGYAFWGIYGVVGWVVVGSFLHFLIQMPGLIGLPLSLPKKITFFDPLVFRTYKLAVPRTVSLALLQVQTLVLTLLASFTGAKSIAILNLTNDFATTPTVIVANALMLAIFPVLSLAWAEKNLSQFQQSAISALKIVLFLLIPSSFLMWILRAQLTRLYLALGKSLDWRSTSLAIETLGLFSLGIVFAGLVVILTRVKYAQHDTLKPMCYSFFSVLLSLIVAYSLTFFSRLGVAGLALSYSLSQILFAGLLYLDLRRDIFSKEIERDLFVRLIPRVLLISLVATLLCWLSLRFADYFLDTHRVLGLLGQAVFAFGVFLGVFVGAAYLFKMAELHIIFESFSLKRFFRLKNS